MSPYLHRVATVDKAFLSSHQEILETSRSERNPLLVALIKEHQLSPSQIAWALDAAYVHQTLPSIGIVCAVMLLKGKIMNALYAYWIASCKGANLFKFASAKQFLLKKLEREAARENRNSVREMLQTAVQKLASL